MAVGVASALVTAAAACGSESEHGGLRPAGEAGADELWTVPAELTGMVVAGDEAGWLAGRNGRIWRVGLDGEVARTEM